MMSPSQPDVIRLNILIDNLRSYVMDIVFLSKLVFPILET